MNKWFSRAVGTVGVAGGMLLLGAGTAHAEDVTATTGALDELISPAGDLAALDGPDNLGATLDTPGARWSAGTMDGGPFAFAPNSGEVGATLHTPDENGQARDVFAGGRLPDLLRSLPATGAALPSKLQSVPATGATLPSKLQGLQGLRPTSALPSPASGAALVRQAGSDAIHVVQASPQTEALPTVGGLPLVGGHLPALTGQGLPPLDAASVYGVLHPVDDFAVPVGGRESARNTESDVPVLSDAPVVGDVLQNNTVSGLPSLPELFNSYLPRHAADDQTEALPAIGGLSSLPLVGNLLAGGAGLLGN